MRASSDGSRSYDILYMASTVSKSLDVSDVWSKLWPSLSQLSASFDFVLVKHFRHIGLKLNEPLEGTLRLLWEKHRWQHAFLQIKHAVNELREKKNFLAPHLWQTLPHSSSLDTCSTCTVGINESKFLARSS